MAASRIAFLFPGQGSQAVGMGKALCDEFEVARETFAEADQALQFPLSQLCFDGPLDDLTLTTNTQPALLATSTAVARVLEAEFGLRPQWAAGHSLGEFSALVCAGALPFAETLRIVRARGAAMQAAVAPGVGSMAALLGLPMEAITGICRDAAEGEVVAPANLNGGGQVVIAGHRGAVERAIGLARAQGARRAIPLTVSAPFHCPLMEPAAEKLRECLAPVTVSAPRFPVLSNVTALPHGEPDTIREALVRQVTHPVRWEECLLELGRHEVTAAIEVGPGRVLTGLVRRVLPDLPCVPGEDLRAVRELLEAA